MSDIRKYFHFEEGKSSFEDLSHTNGFRYWFARDLMNLLGYTEYNSFRKVINKALTVCSTLNIDIVENFHQIERIVDGKNKKDCKLSKFLCYLVVMNADGKKKEVALAQAYFIAITECFKRYVEERQIERVSIRGEVTEKEKSLSQIAKDSGIEHYPFFQNQGYLGLYNKSINELRAYKGIPSKRSPLDFMGREELAANLFRITQTEAKIRNEKIKGQYNLETAAFGVGRKVRNTMYSISKTRPENLPIEKDIVKVKSNLKSVQKEFKKIEKDKSN